MPSHRWPMAAYLVVAVACAAIMAGAVRAQPIGNGIIGDPGRALGAVAARVTLAPGLMSGLDDLPGVPGSEVAVPGVDLTPSTGTASRQQPTDVSARAVVRRPLSSAAGRSRAARSAPASPATSVEGRTHETATILPGATAPEESARTVQPAPDVTAKPGKSASPGKAKQGKAQHAKAQQGKAEHGKGKHAKGTPSKARHGMKPHVRKPARPERGRR